MEIEERIKGLQNQLAQIDLLTTSAGRSAWTKFLVLKLQDLKIKMYHEKGHLRPHVHIDYGRNKHAASYAIDTGERLVGNLDKKYDKIIQEWLEENRDGLSELWNAAQVGEEIEKIICNIRGTT